MNVFDVASQTVQAALQTGQAGQPVAARVIVHLEADHGRIERLAARILNNVSMWFEGRPERLTTFGDVETGQLSTLAVFAGGQTALISVGCCTTADPLLELVVWGNRGIVSWEHDCGLQSNENHLEPNLSDSEKQLFNHVQESVHAVGSIRIGEKHLAEPVARKSGPVQRRHRTEISASSGSKPRAQKPPYGVLLIAGDHTHQPQYAASLDSDPRCRLIGLTDEDNVTPRRRRLNEQLAERLSIPFLPDLHQALHRDDVQIVSVCAEPIRRGRIIIQAAQAGKHLYLDKPLAATLAEADAIREAVDEAGIVSHMWSFVHSDAVARTRRELRSARLGDLKAFHADVCFAKGQSGTAALDARRQETSVPERYELLDSKRELSNVGVYPLVSLLCLQDKTVRRVCATTGNYFFREHQANNMEDFGQMLLELDDGTVATISAGRTGWKSCPAGGLNRTTLVGTKQMATIDVHRPRVSVWADAEEWKAPERDPEDPMGMWGGAPKADRFMAKPKQEWVTPPVSEMNSDAAWFLDCIETGRLSDVSVHVAATATEILLAGYRSAATGTVVDLPLPRGAG